MEDHVENYDDYEYVLLDGIAYDVLARAEEYIEGEDERLLKDVLSEIQIAIEALEKQAALTEYDVEYYDAQSRLLGSIELRKKYLISSYKFSLIINKLNYFRSIKESINNLLGKGMQLIK